MIEVLKQALEVIETAIKAGDWKVDGACDPDNVIHGLRQAIREHAMYEVQRLGQEIEQEPVAWLTRRYVDNFPTSGYETAQPTDYGAFPAYSHPQPKAWIGLTDEDCERMSDGDKVVAMWADRTLKKKNTHPQPQRTEQNFCPRCGKRTHDIHTCTPPQRTEPFLKFRECEDSQAGTATPPQRTWVGLTDEEENEYNYLGPDMHWVIQEIAAKLKEKNS